MALVVITVSDSADGVAVSLISEPAVNLANPGPSITLAQQTAMKMIEAMEMQKDEPSRVLLLNS